MYKSTKIGRGRMYYVVHILHNHTNPWVKPVSQFAKTPYFHNVVLRGWSVQQFSKAASQLSCQNSLEDVAVWPRPSPLVCCSIALDMNSVQLQCCSNSADKATTPTQLRSCIMMTPCIYKLHTFPVPLYYYSSSAVKLENCSSNISMLPVMSRLRQRALQRLSAA